jgi:DNA-directed RNA polymerase sigma subunit (sigma70/sigma32)
MMNQFNTRQPISQFASSPMTLQEIADALNLSKERVRQIEAKARRNFRKKFEEMQFSPANFV